MSAAGQTTASTSTRPIAELASATPEAILAWTWRQFQPEGHPHLLVPARRRRARAHAARDRARGAGRLHQHRLPLSRDARLSRRDRARASGSSWSSSSRSCRARSSPPSTGSTSTRAIPDLCCHINKVEPLKPLPARRARLDQRPAPRPGVDAAGASASVEAFQGELYKVNPMASWTSRDTFYYMERHGIPTHPLFDTGLREHRMRAVHAARASPGEDERDGRWAGTGEESSAGCTRSSSPK